MLAHELSKSGVDPESYWSRIESLKPFAIIGLHGHFLRHPPETGIAPMHLCFHDMEAVKAQIERETEALEARNLFRGGPRCYSAGWWFMTQGLREALRARGFERDFSVSSSPYNQVAINPAKADSASEAGSPNPKDIGSALAISSLAKAGQSASSLLRLTRYVLAGRPHYLTFYGHDFDLEVSVSIAAVKQMVACGFRFVEPLPRPLEHSDLGSLGHGLNRVQ